MDCIPAVDQQQQFTNLTVQQFKSLACATVPGLQYDFNFPLLYLNLWLQKVYKSKNQSITLSLSLSYPILPHVLSGVWLIKNFQGC